MNKFMEIQQQQRPKCMKEYENIGATGEFTHYRQFYHNIS